MSGRLNTELKVTIERDSLQKLLDTLTEKGYKVIGPTLRGEAIVLDEISSVSEMPEGWTDEQESGSYRLKKGSGHALFGYINTPQSWKSFLHTPAKCLLRIVRDRNSFHVADNEEKPQKTAFFGVRPCELNAIMLQDKALVDQKYGDPGYAARRKNILTVVANCGQAGGTCFCLSMNCGPKATSGFDLAMTEVLENGRHYFVIQAGSETGAKVLGDVSNKESTEAEKKSAELVVSMAATQMGRSLDTRGLKELLYINHDNPHWDKVAVRCLSCGNCTMVCPTCFCTTIEDTTDLTGKEAQRSQKWDSCFTMDFSYIHGGSIRASAKSRYRQWLNHKHSAWVDQFGSSGCVGCGRCITWCPAAIDITEEIGALRDSIKGKMATSPAKETKNAND